MPAMTRNQIIIILTVVALINLSTYSFISRCPIRLSKRFCLRNRNFALNAKKKASKFISDDLLSTLESEIEEKEKIKMPVITVDASNKDEDLKSISFKDKKFGKLGLSSDLLSSIIDDEETTVSEDSNENKKKKDKKKKKKGSSNSESSVEEEDTVVHDEVPEESNNVVENVVPVVELDEGEITGYIMYLCLYIHNQL